MPAPPWIPARVGIDPDLGPYPAEILANQRWNGWVIPRFTREVTERIAADLAASNAATAVHPLDAQIVRFDGDAALIVAAPGTHAEEVLDRVDPDGDERYCVGGFRWCWSTVEDPARADPASTDACPPPGTVAGTPDLPPGARLLPPDEAVTRIVTGDHPEAARGGVDMDAALVDAVRSGEIIACRLADGRLAFTRVAGGPDRPSP